MTCPHKWRVELDDKGNVWECIRCGKQVKSLTFGDDESRCIRVKRQVAKARRRARFQMERGEL